MVVVETDVVLLPPSSRLDSKGSTKPGKKILRLSRELKLEIYIWSTVHCTTK